MLNYAETASVSTIVPLESVPCSQTAHCATSLSISPTSSYAIGPIDPAQITTLHAHLSTDEETWEELGPRVPTWIVGWVHADLAQLAETERALALVGVAHLGFLLPFLSLDALSWPLAACTMPTSRILRRCVPQYAGAHLPRARQELRPGATAGTGSKCVGASPTEEEMIDEVEMNLSRRVTERGRALCRLFGDEPSSQNRKEKGND